MVLKKNGQKERYSRDKLLRGLRVSLEKRPISFAKINSLCLNIETELMKKKEDEISTKTIGDTVLKHLKEIDEVAYIRFASVYRDFKTIKGFKREISKFLNDDEKN
jgi:transcriptional repressor NrdR